MSRARSTKPNSDSETKRRDDRGGVGGRKKGPESGGSAIARLGSDLGAILDLATASTGNAELATLRLIARLLLQIASLVETMAKALRKKQKVGRVKTGSVQSEGPTLDELLRELRKVVNRV